MFRFRSRTRASIAVNFAFVLGAWSTASTTHAQFQAGSAGELVAHALERSGVAVRTAQRNEPGWTWQQYEAYDREIPVTIDLVGSHRVPATKIIYFLPGGGTNFQSSFFAPAEHNLAHFFNEQGYLVIGITPREHKLPMALTELSFMSTWGMDQHRDDIRAVVEFVKTATPLPYEMLGHSYGASSALDYASKFPLEMERVIALDIYSIDPHLDPLGALAAQATYDAHVQLLAARSYVDTSGAGANVLATWPRELLLQDSGISREPYGFSGNFTIEGYFFFTMIETAQLPGIHTEKTGLMNDWPLMQSMFSGTYTMAVDPRDDLYALDHMERTTIEAASATAGSGITPLAFARDYWSVVAGNGAYKLDWSAIHSKLVWINAELGYGAQHYGATLTALGGNHDVSVHIIPGYGHGDPLLSRTADRDVWDKLR